MSEDKLTKIARAFIDKHHVTCAEAPLLVEALAEVVGYYQYPEDEACQKCWSHVQV